jgi:hypothetical protein
VTNGVRDRDKMRVVREVVREQPRRPALPLDAQTNFLERLGSAGDDVNQRAPLREPYGDGPADSDPSARDQGNPVREGLVAHASGGECERKARIETATWNIRPIAFGAGPRRAADCRCASSRLYPACVGPIGGNASAHRQIIEPAA